MSKRFRDSLRVVVSLVLLLALERAGLEPAFGAETPKFSDQRADGLMVIQGGQEQYDFFEASTNPHVKHQLDLVNKFHMDQKVFDNFKAGRYQNVLNDIDFTLRHFPNHPRALQLLTAVAALSKNVALPIRYFETAIGLYPMHAVTHAQYGWYIVTIGDLEGGIERLNYAVRLDPKLIAGYVWLAQAYEKKGDVKSAREARERAKELGYSDKSQSGASGEVGPRQ